MRLIQGGKVKVEFEEYPQYDWIIMKIQPKAKTKILWLALLFFFLAGMHREVQSENSQNLDEKVQR